MIGAFYGMGDFMSGSSDSVDDHNLVFKRAIRRDNHYSKHMFRNK